MILALFSGFAILFTSHTVATTDPILTALILPWLEPIFEQCSWPTCKRSSLTWSGNPAMKSHARYSNKTELTAFLTLPNTCEQTFLDISDML